MEVNLLSSLGQRDQAAQVPTVGLLNAFLQKNFPPNSSSLGALHLSLESPPDTPTEVLGFSQKDKIVNKTQNLIFEKRKIETFSSLDLEFMEKLTKE